MNDRIAVSRLAAADLPAAAPGLAALLVDAVDDGASVGFTSALTPEKAAAWWSDLAPALSDERIAAWTARDGDRLVGTVQLRCETSPNGRHRAEIAKLVVHRSARGRGIARRLLTTAEEFARSTGRTLLMLDTQTGSTAERLYRSAGWTPLGTVPDYAADPSGVLRPTTFFHKTLQPAPQGPERTAELTGAQAGPEA
ncbi:GNAT superfamily N-acetyltransferase [Streptomyces sp. V4I23]|uniref:GNAT family N-acetyltransferase n=1 Tax=Streptomyces sp. V4I23 TaxID=3042282 RepID=UPI0027890CB2|nr:GNAT family N-acetyltransferase [Streptomyces sp. V4I23]MDQ1009131.1 GNAT superfamily N-acetyltransferase [Streptomyces sp. V4I23]